MTTQPEMPLPNEDHPLACPQCRRVDLVRKVSSIVEQETVTGTTNTRGSTLGVGAVGGQLAVGGASTVNTGEHFSQSALAQKLSLPNKPELTAPKLTKYFQVCAVIAALLVIGILTSIGDKSHIPVGVWAVLIVLILAGIGAKLGIPEATKRDEKNWSDWNGQWDAWQKSFYCSRCDGVFRPGDTTLRSPQGSW
jgi:hypothetical protein